MTLKKVAILHHPHSEGALAFARQLAHDFIRRGVEATVADVWSPTAKDLLVDVGLIVCIGGDGTVLRAARLAVPNGAPLLGINMGRLGFLTDMSPRDFYNHFERILLEDWRIEERLMVRADLFDGDITPTEHHGLNDIVVSRSSPGRPIYVDLAIDHAHVAVYRCDGMIVSTPTGSTGYSLSAGGPILAPTEHHLVVTPVSAHLSLARSLVLQPTSVVELRVTSDHGAILSVDGQDDVQVASGSLVRIRQSEHVTRFARFADPSLFYSELAEKLDMQMSSAVNRA
ncbi:MAG: NAD(+)/NADH kinase [Dehalococcoidia bacterium]|nr:NAD(+)/NADH kinase [Dehalococcoidia bacterium]